MSGISRPIAIQSDLDAYQGFFDEGSAKRLMFAVRDTKLKEPAFDLLRNWQAASNARSLPWILVKSVEAVMAKRLDDCEPFDLKKIRILRDKLVTKLEAKGEKLRPSLGKKLQEAISEIDEDATSTAKNVKQETIDRFLPLWHSLIDIEEFHTSIWASERMCYASIYFSYECFLVETIRKRSGDPDLRLVREDDIKKRLKAGFGGTISGRCWTDEPICVARRVRHALTHNGGRSTRELSRMPHGMRVEGDELQIAASQTTILYKLLAERSHELAVAAAAFPELRQ